MRPLPRVFALAAATGCAALLAGCSTLQERLPEARYTLKESQTLPLDERLTITYEGAEDSRCPDDANCRWPGQLVYRFTMRVGSVAQSFHLVRGQPGYMSPALRGSRIELDHMTPPPPRSMTRSGPGAYPVTFNMYAQ